MATLEHLKLAQAKIKEDFGVETNMVDWDTKFGINFLTGTTESFIMGLGAGELVETLPTTNAIDTFVCSDTNYDGVVSYIGHSISNGLLTRVEDTVTANGQNTVSLPTPVCRIQRSVDDGTGIAAGSAGYFFRSADNAGVTSGVPDTAASINMVMPGYHNRSLKAAISSQNEEYIVILDINFAVSKKTGGGAIFYVRRGIVGEARQTLRIGSAHSTNGYTMNKFEFALIMEPNSDFICVAEADASSTPISAEFSYARFRVGAPQIFAL